MGIRTKRGGLFEKRNISYILQNKFYVGTLEWNGITAKGQHETFISPELFEQAQEIITSTFKSKKRRSVSTCKHWLAGLVKCSICGASLSYNTGKYPRFVCWRYAKGFHKGNSSISEEKLIAAVLTYLEKILNGMDFTVSYIEKEDPQFTEEDQLEKDWENLSVREKRIRTAYETGVDSLEEYKENKARLKKEREELEAKRANLIQTAAAPDTKELFLEKVKTVFDILKSDEVETETKGVFIRSIVEEIIYDKEKDTLTFHLYTPQKTA